MARWETQAAGLHLFSVSFLSQFLLLLPPMNFERTVASWSFDAKKA